MAYYVKPNGEEREYIAYLDLTSEQRLALNRGNLYERRSFAAKGLALDFLSHDDEFSVRMEVARQGYGLKDLSADPSPEVRCAAFLAGYRSSSVVLDEDFTVRLTAAREGWYLDDLLVDEDSGVRAACDEFLIGAGLTYSEWVEAYPERRAMSQPIAPKASQAIPSKHEGLLSGAKKAQMNLSRPETQAKGLRQ